MKSANEALRALAMRVLKHKGAVYCGRGDDSRESGAHSNGRLQVIKGFFHVVVYLLLTAGFAAWLGGVL